MTRPKQRPRVDRKNLIIRRVSTYLRTLDHLRAEGVEVMSSRDFEKIEGVTQSLVRRDLAEFGTFGVRGVGYPVGELRDQLARVLGLDRRRNVVLIGAGGFGSVLIHSESFRQRNLEVTQIFDQDSAHIGGSIEGIAVHDMARLEQELDARSVDLAIVAVAPPEVQGVIDRLGRLGVRGALYFASRPVKSPANMVVLNMDISVELGLLTYLLD